MKTAKLKCLFCEKVIIFLDGDLFNFQTHLEYDHEVTFRKELVLALSFLSEDEIEVLASKMVPRMEFFLEHGSVSGNSKDIFEGEVVIEQIIDKDNQNEDAKIKEEPLKQQHVEEKDPLSLKPCNILIKKIIPTTTEANERSSESDNDDIIGPSGVRAPAQRSGH